MAKIGRHLAEKKKLFCLTINRELINWSFNWHIEIISKHENERRVFWCSNTINKNVKTKRMSRQWERLVENWLRNECISVWLIIANNYWHIEILEHECAQRAICCSNEINKYVKSTKRMIYQWERVVKNWLRSEWFCVWLIAN